MPPKPSKSPLPPPPQPPSQLPPIITTSPLCKMPFTYVLGIKNTKDFKVHCAVKNWDNTLPLDAYWQGRWNLNQWNANAPVQGGGGPYNRKHIIAFMRWGDRAHGLWLFGCIYEVMAGWKKPKKNTHPHLNKWRWFYEIRSLDIGKGHSGTLIVKIPFHGVSDVRRDLNYKLKSNQLLSGQYRTGRGNLLSDNIVVYGELKNPHRDWEWF